MSAEDIPGLQDWLEEVADDLGVPHDLVLPDPLLQVAHDVAHEVIRPGAPTSTYLIGLALGLELGRAEEGAPDAAERLGELSRRVRALAAARAQGPGPEAAGTPDPS